MALIPHQRRLSCVQNSTLQFHQNATTGLPMLTFHRWMQRKMHTNADVLDRVEVGAQNKAYPHNILPVGFVIAADVIISWPHIEQGFLIEISAAIPDCIPGCRKLPTADVHNFFWHWAKPLHHQKGAERINSTLIWPMAPANIRHEPTSQVLCGCSAK